MPFSFPSNPTIGQESTQNGRTYRWTGAAWELVSQIQAHTHSVTDLTATGTPSASTFLRGDGAWASAGSTSASDLVEGTLANARLTTRARASMNLYLWSSFR